MRFKDITFYFKSSCCNGQSSAAKPPLSELCQNGPLHRQHTHIEQWFNKNIDMHAATITIGNKYYGKLSYKDQYKHMVKAIKRTYPYHGDTKYVFHFELQSNGNLHAHGVVINGYQNKFIDGFNHLGLRNTHDKSYEPIKNISKYLEYINKENILPPITNIASKAKQPRKGDESGELRESGTTESSSGSKNPSPQTTAPSPLPPPAFTKKNKNI